MFWVSRTVLGHKNTVYYQYSLQINERNMAKVYFNHKLIIAFEIVRVKKAIPWSEYNSTHLIQ